MTDFDFLPDDLASLNAFFEGLETLSFFGGAFEQRAEVFGTYPVGRNDVETVLMGNARNDPSVALQIPADRLDAMREALSRSTAVALIPFTSSTRMAVNADGEPEEVTTKTLMTVDVDGQDLVPVGVSFLHAADLTTFLEWFKAEEGALLDEAFDAQAAVETLMRENPSLASRSTLIGSHLQPDLADSISLGRVGEAIEAARRRLR